MKAFKVGAVRVNCPKSRLAGRKESVLTGSSLLTRCEPVWSLKEVGTGVGIGGQTGDLLGCRYVAESGRWAKGGSIGEGAGQDMARGGDMLQPEDQ